MPWFKVDDALAMHPKSFAAGNSALGLWVRAGSWSMQHLTDGHIPDGLVAALGGGGDDTAALVNAGLWRQADGGFQFHDWAEYQPTREQVEAERAKTRERVEKHRSNSRSNDVGNGVTTRVVQVSQSQSQSQSRPQTPTYVSESQSLDNRARETTDELSAVQQQMAASFGLDVPRVQAKIRDQFGIGLSPVSALAIGTWLLNKRGTPPRTPTPYVLGSISRSPAEIEKYIHDSGLT